MFATVTHPRPDVVLVTLAGELDLAAMDELRAALAPAGARADVLVDAAAVDFIDCGALRALVEAAGAATAAGGRLRLRAPSPAVLRLVAWCGVDARLPVVAARPRYGRRRAAGRDVIELGRPR